MCGPRNPCAKTPIDVVGLENGVAGLTLNGDHSCIVNNAGGVECWGGGVLGLGTTYSIVPLDVGVEAKPPPTPTPIPTATPDAVGGVAFDPPAHSDSSPWLVALPLAAFAFGAGAFAYRRAR